jgi:hypothetical protein
MPARLSYDVVRDYIHEKGYELISKEYVKSKHLLEIKCNKCNKIYKQCFTSFKKGYFHPFCQNEERIPFGGYKTPFVLVPIICVVCNKEFQPNYSKRTCCSHACSKNIWKTPEYREKGKKNGKEGGKISATRQSRRSKNEIYFSELCSAYFTITTNEPFFDGWDADVIIHSEKIAVLWNGIWHYKQISKSQSLLQVQTRDKIKFDAIEKAGYIPYIIKDMGKYNRNFVEQEFEIFMMMRMSLLITK